MIMIICSLASPCLSCFIQSRSRILFNLTTIWDQVSQCFCQNSSCAKCFSPPANQPSYDLPGMQSCRTVHLNPIIFKSKVKCGTTHATRIPVFFHIPTCTNGVYHRPAALLPSIYRMQWLDRVEPWPRRERLPFACATSFETHRKRCSRGAQRQNAGSANHPSFRKENSEQLQKAAMIECFHLAWTNWSVFIPSGNKALELSDETPLDLELGDFWHLHAMLLMTLWLSRKATIQKIS